MPGSLRREGGDLHSKAISEDEPDALVDVSQADVRLLLAEPFGKTPVQKRDLFALHADPVVLL